MNDNKLGKMGLGDMLNLEAGRDWSINVAIPNRILRRYPSRVMWLQTQIRCLLESFNNEIQQLEKGIVPTAKITKIEKQEESVSEDTKQSIVLKMKQEEEKRNQGGGSTCH